MTSPGRTRGSGSGTGRVVAHRRRAPLVAEIVGLALLTAADLAITLVHPAPDGGLLAASFTSITPAIGVGAAVVAVLRRHFGRIALLTLVVASASLLVSVVSGLADWAGAPVQAQSPLTEALALALLCGAVCHQLPSRSVAPLVVLVGVAATIAAPLRFGLDSSWALLAVPAALMWGGSVATGLVLRDADGRYDAELARARESERLTLARELHDFVAHHVTGIVVLAQGAQVAAARRDERPGSYPEIEQAGGEALSAMRRLVGMLRTEEPGDTRTGDDPPRPALLAELKEACGNDPRVRLTTTPEVDRLSLPPALITAAHRIVLEAVTNARRYAVPGSPIEVSAGLRRKGLTAALELTVVNAVPAQAERGEGYGLVGMAERAQALGGTLSSGAGPTDEWRVHATLPVEQRFH
ncbi:sensor histidine kinase [Kribbella italica]|uniref:histidine kinase n=1 Tax=Kribbella italica TaxID=1540520 RepID=A0A7W9JET8_9ACTN|nr:histidine kinase [Kribbella italica]MBB5840801.1 signal transduction histidine kinase [Kribbella italica]